MFFLSEGSTIAHLDRSGILQRELALYKGVAAAGHSVQVVSYGGRRDRGFRQAVAPLQLCAAPWISRPSRLAQVWYPLNLLRLMIHLSPAIAQADILKTNQVSGARIALACKYIFGKKLLVRCGWVPSRILELARQQGFIPTNLGDTRALCAREKRCFIRADAVAVPTEEDREWVLARYALSPRSVHVLPNSVDTRAFKPLPREKKYDVLLIGRDSPEKNLDAAFDAVEKTAAALGRTISLICIGGCGRHSKAAPGALNGVTVMVKGTVPHEELPELFNQSKVLLQPSLYEGHPKTIIEAMACGTCCLASNVPNITSVITHAKTGFLCSPRAGHLAEALGTLLMQQTLRETLGGAASEEAVRRFSLEQAISRETEVLERMLRP